MILWEDAGGLIDGKTGAALDAAAARGRVRARRDALAREGLREGDRAALVHGNSPELLIDVLALWGLGACAVPLDPAAPAPERARALDSAAPQALIGPGRFERLRGPAKRAPGEALLLHTSGTTGRPKGVVHTAESLAAKFAALSRHVGGDGWRTALCLLPMHFGHGLICNALWPWLASKDLVVLPANDLDAVSRLGATVDRWRADFFSTVPSVWRWALHAGAAPPRGGTLKRVHCASAALDAGLWERANAWAGAPVVNVYGTTETAGWIAGTEPGEAPRDGLVGRGWGCAFEARDARDGAGEIWARSDSLMRGYDGAPELTAAAVKDGWYRTGDAGSVDASGSVRLKGRVDDVINKAGLKVYPDEVEEALRACPDVADACVFGEPHPIFGQEVAAAVVPRNAGALDAARTWCEARLSAFKVPRSWHELKEIPRSERGKVNRRRVAEICGR